MHLLFNAEHVPEVIDNNLQALSWSFSHFMLWQAFRLQFDCGEGTGMRLDKHVFRPETLVMSHGHFDHTRGLLGLLNVRSGLMGATEKPLTIIYPDNATMMNRCISEARSFVARRQLDQVAFCPAEDGQRFALRKGFMLDTKSVPHVPGQPCFAYRVGEQRKRLRPEYRNLPGREIAELGKQGKREQIEETFFASGLVYSGDTEYLDRDFCREAHVLIHEANFLNAEDAELDREGHHSLVEDALRCAAEAKVKHLILFHISRRYENEELSQGIQKLIDCIGLECPVLALRGSFNLRTD